MAITNRNKVEKLEMGLRLGVARRWSDGHSGDAIRAWLRDQGVIESGLPSDKTLRSYAKTDEAMRWEESRVTWLLKHTNNPNGTGADDDPGVPVLADPLAAIDAMDWRAPETEARMLQLSLLEIHDQLVASRTLDAELAHATAQARRFEDLWLRRVEARELAGLQGKTPPALGKDPYLDREEGLARERRADAAFDAGLTDAEFEAEEREREAMAAAKAAKNRLSFTDDLFAGDSSLEARRAAMWAKRRDSLEANPKRLKPAMVLRTISNMLRLQKELRILLATIPATGHSTAKGPGGRSMMDEIVADNQSAQGRATVAAPVAAAAVPAPVPVPTRPVAAPAARLLSTPMAAPSPAPAAVAQGTSATGAATDCRIQPDSATFGGATGTPRVARPGDGLPPPPTTAQMTALLARWKQLNAQGLATTPSANASGVA